MKNFIFFITLICTSLHVFCQDKTDGQKRNLAFYDATRKWFSAWKLVSKSIYNIDKVRPVEFVLFDDKYVYSTSSVSVKIGKTVKGCNLMNLSFVWKKCLHNDTIILPDRSRVPIRLMSFASEVTGKNHTSFFVMPLPGYWKKSGITSKELGLDNLVTGVFIHEFSHSQQMQNFGKKISAFESQNKFGIQFSDARFLHPKSQILTVASTNKLVHPFLQVAEAKVLFST